MNRVIVLDAALPQVTDILNTNKFALEEFAYAYNAILGTPTALNGLACAPTAPASMNVTVGSGSIFELDTTDATAYGDLGTDATEIVKQGILSSPVTLAITAPTTSGYSQIYLVEAALQDLDGGLTVLPFYNPSNPQQPYSGPNNDGQPSYTVRECNCVIALKAGVAAPTGSETAPSPDAGYTGLYLITVTNGQSTITSSSIATYANAPFIPVTLPLVPAGVQAGKWVYAADTSTTINAMVAHGFFPSISMLTPGMGLLVKVGRWATVSLTGNTSNGSPTISSVSSISGLAVGQELYGTNIPGGTTISAIGSTTITMSANATGNATGETITAQGNTGAVTLDVGTGAQPVVLANGSAVPALTISGANQILYVVWDGSHWQIVNSFGISSSGGSTTINNTFNTSLIPYTADTSVTPNQITAPFSPAITSPSAGQLVVVKLANTITGATQIAVNALSNVAVVNQYLQPLQAYDAVAGEMLLLCYTGSVWQLCGAGSNASASGGLAGQYANLSGSATGGTKTASWTADEATVETTFGGTPYKGINLSLSFNGATVGANGMDTGSPPTSADLSIYLIYNPTTQTWSTLGVAGSTSNGTIYAGSHMPSGYTASALLWTGKTDSSGNVTAFNQINHLIEIFPTAPSITGSFGGGWNGIFPGIGGSNFGSSMSALSLSTVVPANAKAASGSLSLSFSSGDTNPTFGAAASTSTGIGAQIFGVTSGGAVISGTFTNIELVTAQTIYVNSVTGGLILLPGSNNSAGCLVNAYSF